MLFETFASKLAEIDQLERGQSKRDPLVQFLIVDFAWGLAKESCPEGAELSETTWGQSACGLSFKEKEMVLEELKAVLYLCQGRIGFPYVRRRPGRRTQEQVLDELKSIPISGLELQVVEVYRRLHQAAPEILTWVNSSGSMPKPLRMLISCFNSQVARTRLVQIVTGPWYEDERLIEFLSRHFSAPGARKKGIARIEESYPATLPDLGHLAEMLWKHEKRGYVNLEFSTLLPGLPFMPERIASADSVEDVWQLLPEACYVQPKFDGWQVQIHKQDDRVWLFGRDSEDLTERLKDISEACRTQLAGHSAILDSEVIGVDPATGRIMPFKETLLTSSHQAIVFDLLFLDDKNWYQEKYRDRKDALLKLLPPDPSAPVWTVEEQHVTSRERLQTLFDQWINDPRYEGMVVKNAGGIYNPAGKSKGKWKVKNYVSLDLVVLGYTKRNKYRFLMGAWDHDREVFVPVGETDIKYDKDEIEMILHRIKDSVTDKIPPKVEPSVVPAVWVRPEVVLEVGAHKRIQDERYFNAGCYSLPPEDQRKFRYRPDKSPEDANTLQDFFTLLKPAPGQA